MAKVGADSVAVDLVDFLNASPTAFHAVGNPCLRSITPCFSSVHSLISVSRSGGEATPQGSGVRAPLGEGRLGSETWRQVLFHPQSLHYHRLRHWSKVDPCFVFLHFYENLWGKSDIFSVESLDMLLGMDSTSSGRTLTAPASRSSLSPR